MTPTIPSDPGQQIDQTFQDGELVEEIVHNYPPDGGGVRRWVDEQGEHSEPVTGLPVVAEPVRTADDKLADAHAILAEAAVLPSPVTPADLADILARAAAALNGGV